MAAYESADRWNSQNPPGTRVRVTLRDGRAIVAETVGAAQQWGDLALVQLKDHVGRWTTRALVPIMVESTEANRP